MIRDMPASYLHESSRNYPIASIQILDKILSLFLTAFFIRHTKCDVIQNVFNISKYAGRSFDVLKIVLAEHRGYVGVFSGADVVDDLLGKKY